MELHSRAYSTKTLSREVFTTPSLLTEPPVCAKFETCPVEIKLMVVKLLPLGDCRSMISVSKYFKRIAQACFYLSVNLPLSQGPDFAKDLLRFQQAGEHNLAMIEHFTVLNASRKGIADGLLFPSDYCLYTRTGIGIDSKLVERQVSMFNQMILEILYKIPTLRSLGWYHTCPMLITTFSTVLSKFSRCLRELHISELDGHAVDFLVPKDSCLTKIECRTAHGGGLMTSTSSLKPSLQALKRIFDQIGGNVTHLSFGNEACALAEYKCNRWFLKMPAGVQLDRLMEKMTNSRNVLPTLTHLDIKGFGVSPCHPSALDLRWTFNFRQLQRLCLESCFGSDVLLSNLITVAPTSSGPVVQCSMNLKEFVFRHEAPTQHLKQALESFISSFSGLRLLSVLLDNITDMIDYQCFMRTHGPTLKVLVWEGRRHSRGETPISLETRDSTGKSFLCHLVNNCPNLEELSIALDMRLGYTTRYRSDRIKYGVPFQVCSLRHLKTLHSRVLPSPDRVGTSHDFVVHANKVAVASFLDWGYYSQWNSRVAPRLRLVAVGPLSYHDRWMRRCCNATGYGPAGPIFYDVSVTKNTIGEYSHVLSPLGKYLRIGSNFINKTVDTIKEDYSHSRVFESYWLK